MNTSFSPSYNQSWRPMQPVRARRIGLPHFLTIFAGGLLTVCPWLPWLNCNIALAVFSGDVAVNGWGNTIGFTLPMVNFKGVLSFDGLLVVVAGLTIVVLGLAHMRVNGAGGLLVFVSTAATGLMGYEHSTLQNRLNLNWLAFDLPFFKGEAGLGLGLFIGLGAALLALTNSLLSTLIYSRLK